MTTPRPRYSVVAMKDRRNIFVSYSHKDAKDVQTILAQIPQRGFALAKIAKALQSAEAAKR